MRLLSVAMIVKNEEHNIERALNSIKDIADEIVIVDTGSTDKTVEIARKYTDKVYFHPWKNDFSEARNNSLKYPTCEWVLILDADEEVSDEFKVNIRKFLEKLPRDVNTIYLPTISYLDWDLKKTEVTSTPRIFRNGTVYYQNIVHNQPVYKAKVAHANFSILHYGYIWTRKLKKQKYERTRNLIKEHLENTKSENDRLYYLIQLYKTERIGGQRHLASKVAYETYQVLRNSSKVPAIAFEFMYIFSLELSTVGMFETAQELLEKVMSVVPKYPDPYFAMVFLCYKKQDWQGVLSWREKFIQKVDEASKIVEKFEWTIMSFKEISTADLFGCLAALKTNDYSTFNNIASKLANQGTFSNEQIVQLVLDEIASQDLSKIIEGTKNILQYCLKNRIAVKVDKLVEAIAEQRAVFHSELLLQFKLSDFSKLILERLQTKKDLLLKFINHGDLLDIVKKERIRGLIFIYSLLNDDEKEQFLRNLTEHADQDLMGCIHALFGDLYLKQAKFLDALRNYRKSVELFPELSRFIKPILDDLKTKFDPSIDGVFDELYKFYMESLELPIDIAKYCEDKADKLFLISESDVALYVSAIHTKDNDKKLWLLERIKSPEKFPMYYYRLAKIFEKKDKAKALEFHIKAVEANEKLADINLGVYNFTGLYPSIVPPWTKNNDEIVWVGNISEKISCLGIIHPVRVWKRSKEGFIYATPFPSDEALKEYEKREKETYKTSILKYRKQDLYNILAELKWNDVKIFENQEEYDPILKELGIIVDEKSNNQILHSVLNQQPDFEKFIKAKTVLLIHFFPDLSDESDLVWYYPAFRVFWDLPTLKKKVQSIGYRLVTYGMYQSNLRYALIECD